MKRALEIRPAAIRREKPLPSFLPPLLINDPKILVVD